MKKTLLLSSVLNLSLAEAKTARTKLKPEVFPTDTIINNNKTRVSSGLRELMSSAILHRTVVSSTLSYKSL